MATYEWAIETLDAEPGDEITEDTNILDVSHADTYEEALAQAERADYNERPIRICLVRDSPQQDCYLDRTWAYLDESGDLPEFFSDLDRPQAFKVPAKFHKEIARHKNNP